MDGRDERYLDILVRAIRVCGSYKPMMGHRNDGGIDLPAFQALYAKDLFYHWLGLDNPRMYAAHKAAGGMTSVYRQIGNGVEYLFRQILRDKYGFTDEQAAWNYSIPGKGQKRRTLSLDGRIDLTLVSNPSARAGLEGWLARACDLLEVDPRVAKNLKGIVFEVRQGYKSKDAKRQTRTWQMRRWPTRRRICLASWFFPHRSTRTLFRDTPGGNGSCCKAYLPAGLL